MEVVLTTNGGYAYSVDDSAVADYSLSGIENQGITDTISTPPLAVARGEEVSDFVRSRAGRLLKPVTRLIQIMYRKTGLVL